MLSVIILCAEVSPEALVRTLAPLVAGSVRGLLRDVVLAGPADADLALVADHAGCVFVDAVSEAEVLAKAPGRARGDALMILYAGYVPEPGLFEELEDLLTMGLAMTSGARLLRAAPEGFLERLFPQLAPAVGLVAAREFCMAKSVTSFRQLCKATGARRTLRRHLRRIG